MSSRSLNFKKEHLLKFNQQLEEQWNFDSNSNSNLSTEPKMSIDLKIELKLVKIENLEKTRQESLERLTYLINVIKAKQTEIFRKEMILLNKIRSKKTSVQIKQRMSNITINDGISTYDDDDSDTSGKQIKSKSSLKRKLKISINHYHTTKKMKILKYNKSDKLISIGPNGTKVPKSILEIIDWNSTTSATRSLLMTVFDRETLAFHTLTGKRSPAFAECNDMPVKDQLDPIKVADIIFCVMKNCNVPERDVKMAITTKCADENKMFKQRQKRKNLLSRTM